MSNHQDKQIHLDEPLKEVENEIESKSLSEAEKFLLTLKEHFLWSILTTTYKLHPVPRIVNLQYNTDVGFFITTKSNNSKLQQISKNPIGTIIIYPQNGISSAVAHVSLRIANDKKIFDSAWYDDLLKVGFSGKNDEDLRVILLTIHSVRFGKDIYSGVPIDGSIYDHIGQDEVAPLPSGPFKTKEISELLKKTFSPMKNGNLITMNGLEHDSRIMTFIHQDGIGLFSITQIGSRKMKQIVANANVSLLIEDRVQMSQIVVDAVAKICSNPEIKKKIWNDGMKQYGYSGPDDEKLVVILFTPRRVILHTLTAPRPDILEPNAEVLVCEPIQYDKDVQILKSLSRLDTIVHLTTIDENVIPHCRIVGSHAMGTIMYSPVLGFFFTCRSIGNKTKHLGDNSHAIITGYKDSTGDSFVIECEIAVQSDKQVLISTWNPFMQKIGYIDPENTIRAVLQINVTKAEYMNVKDFYACLTKK